MAGVVFALIGWILGLGVGGAALALVASAVMPLWLVLARGHFATPVKSIQAFWLIIMTDVGVDYVLGVGLHSYGFGTGALAWRMLGVGMLDLALVALCCVIHLARLRVVNRPALTRQPRGGSNVSRLQRSTGKAGFLKTRPAGDTVSRHESRPDRQAPGLHTL